MYKACVGYMGSIMLNMLKLCPSSAEDLEALWDEGEEKNIDFYDPYYERVVYYQKKINEVLKASDISNIKWYGTLKKEHTDPIVNAMEPDSQYLMPFSAPVQFDVFLPVSNRKYGFEVRYVNNLTTKFTVIYDGATFLAYAFIENSSEETMLLGPEIREYLVTILSCDYWTAEILPPCPIRESFYFVTEEEGEKNTLYLDPNSDTVIRTPCKTEKELCSKMSDFYDLSRFQINRFLEIIQQKHLIEKTIYDIQRNFNTVCQLYKEGLQKGSSDRKTTKELSTMIFEMYNICYRYEASMYKYRQEFEGFLNVEKDDYTPSFLVNYFEKEFKIRDFPLENIKNGLAHIVENLNARKTNNYVLISAVIGAISGAIFTGIGSLIVALIQ